MKEKIYRQIADEVNPLGVVERSIESIKDKWQTLKKKVKDKVSANIRRKKLMREKTGGGENPSVDDPDFVDTLTEEEKAIVAIIPEEQLVGTYRLHSTIVHEPDQILVPSGVSNSDSDF